MFRSKKNSITFSTDKSLIGAIPSPNKSNKFFPNWFKSLKRRDSDKPRSVGTIKTCIPFVDAMSSGYIIPLWADLLVTVYEEYHAVDENGKSLWSFHKTTEASYEEMLKEAINNGVKPSGIKKIGKNLKLEFPNELNLKLGKNLSEHSWDQVGDLCDLKNFEFGKTLLKFSNPWVIETPKGYSCYFKNPPNNWSTDIVLIEGVVDTDEYHANINFPFVWKGNEIGEFLIPKGTPLVHVVPIKRENLKLEVTEKDYNKVDNTNFKLNTKFIDKYKSLFWHKRKSNEF